MKALLFVGYQFSWFSWVDQTTKFGSQRKGDFHWSIYWKPQNHKFKNQRTCVISQIHENRYPRIKVLSQYFELWPKVSFFFCTVCIDLYVTEVYHWPIRDYSDGVSFLTFVAQWAIPYHFLKLFFICWFSCPSVLHETSLKLLVYFAITMETL